MITKCRCQKLPDVVKIPDSQETLFPGGLVEEHVRANWTKLCRCAVCGSHWQLDEWDKYEEVLAIRVVDTARWETFNDSPFRAAYLTEKMGGTSDQECAKAGCHAKALRGLAYCGQHAVEIGRQ
jgi:hypothetical protein